MQNRTLPSTFRSIQYLRAFAALFVLVFHLSIRLGRPLPVGAAGVDVFFVISGFVMWVVTLRRPVPPGAFIAHRLLRIVPAYWTVTLALLAAAVLIPAAFPHLQTPPSHVLQSMLFIPHLDPEGAVFPLLVPGWTLNYEMGFYALFAAGLLLPPIPRAWAVTAVLCGLVAAGVVWQPSGPVAATYTSGLLLEFCGGLWLGVLATSGRLPGRRGGAALVVAALVGFVAAAWVPGAADMLRLLAWGVPAWCLVTEAVAWEVAGGIRLSRVGMQLGASSYALYLLHGLVVSVTWRLFGAWSGVAFVVASLGGAIAVAVGFSMFVEQPMTTLLQRLVRPWNRTARTIRA